MDRIKLVPATVEELVEQQAEEEVPDDANDDDFHGNSALGKKFRNTKTSWNREEGAVLFEGGVSPSDIQQGSVGDCYFLAALSAIAEIEGVVEKLFLPPNGKGQFGIRWYVHGYPHDIWVDDRLPTHKGKLLFAGSNKKELWVSLLEKAFAKEHGAYSNIDGGLPGHILSALTGKPCTSINLQTTSSSKVWKALNSANTKGKILCCGVMGSPLRRYLLLGMERYLVSFLSGVWWVIDTPLDMCGLGFVTDFFAFVFSLLTYVLRKLYGFLDTIMCGIPSTIHVMLCTWMVGLVPGHAYGVLDVKEIPILGSCCGTRLVKLRNPWGKTEWKGRYSDKSCCWTLRSGLRKELGQEDKDDGSFWMLTSAFQSYFDRLDILHMDLPHQTRLTGKLVERNGQVTINVPAPCKIRISMHQPRRREPYSLKLTLSSGASKLFDGPYVGEQQNTTEEIDISAAGDYVVGFTVRGAKKLGFRVVFVVNSTEPGSTFKNLEAAGPKNGGAKIAPGQDSDDSSDEDEAAPAPEKKKKKKKGGLRIGKKKRKK
jgi:hypothetical protein